MLILSEPTNFENRETALKNKTLRSNLIINDDDHEVQMVKVYPVTLRTQGEDWKIGGHFD